MIELHCRNIDRAVVLFAVDPVFRFCVDGSVVVAEYTKTRAPARVQEMRDALESGHLGVNTFYSNFLSGVVSLEEMYRSAELALTLPISRTTGLRYANLTDVPTYARSIASVWAIWASMPLS